MVDTGIFATTAQIGYKAGAGKSATSAAEAYTNFYIGMAESIINCMTRKNWSDAYAGLNADVKYILQDAASSLAAIYVIMYDFSGYSSKAEAQTMIDILRDSFIRDIELLKDLKTQDFMTGA